MRGKDKTALVDLVIGAIALSPILILVILYLLNPTSR